MVSVSTIISALYHVSTRYERVPSVELRSPASILNNVPLTTARRGGDTTEAVTKSSIFYLVT